MIFTMSTSSLGRKFLPRNISDKQKRFCEEYIVDLNATQAAIRAGYSKKTAQQQASRLLLNVVVSEAIKSGLEARSKRAEKSADWVRERLEYEAEFGESGSARVSALDKLMKFHGGYEANNAQKSAAMSDKLTDMLRRAYAAEG